ncbi:hypothetical protein F7725_005831 [Dissostichus mawsoni]|uniref:Transmembrane protein 154 n=1 Tax=Dissostichus mawsoni TaxID=36200 RepID=A0A7J5YSL1_DISMA|nr:hypothetical protein F7725_005831 [Dissostichus mawsoni]
MQLRSLNMFSQIRKCDAVTVEEKRTHNGTMFASGTGSMRGPGLKTPLLLLLLLWAQDDANVEEEAEADIEPGEEAEEAEPETDGEPEDTDVSESTLPPDFTTPYGDVEFTIGEEQDGSGRYFSEPNDEETNTTDTTDPETDEGLGLLIILIPVVLVVLIIAIIVFCIFINRRPMFEEDVPSVLELEMEELDNWMRKDEPLLQHTRTRT